VKLNTIAERIAHEKSLPWRGPALVDLDSCCDKALAKLIELHAFESKMTQGIRTASLVVDRNVQVQSIRVKPDAGAHGQ